MSTQVQHISVPVAVTGVDRGGRLTRVPNAPSTPSRTFRIPDELYQAAKECAELDGETLSDVVRASLERYVKRARKRQAAASARSETDD